MPENSDSRSTSLLAPPPPPPLMPLPYRGGGVCMEAGDAGDVGETARGLIAPPPVGLSGPSALAARACVPALGAAGETAADQPSGSGAAPHRAAPAAASCDRSELSSVASWYTVDSTTQCTTGTGTRKLTRCAASMRPCCSSMAQRRGLA